MEAHEYVLKLPLQQMALRKIAIILWNRMCYDSPRHETLAILEKKVKENVPKLFLPSFLREELMHLIKPIVEEIQRWRYYHRWLIPPMVVENELYQLCWTPQGTVDYRKVAEKLVRLGRVDTISGYNLSCIYCFDDDIRKFWGKLHESYKKRYHNTKTFEDFCLRRRRGKLVTFWTYFLKGDTDSMINQYEDEPQLTFFQHAFESAVLSGNRVATEYFFQKLTLEERKSSLVEIAQRAVEARFHFIENFSHDFPAQNFWNVVSYLLSKMSEEQQIEVFKNHPFATLVCFLDCPWQAFFMKIAGHMWKFLSFQEYRGMLLVLSENRYISAFNHGKIFEEFFLQSPSHYKNGLLRNLPTKIQFILNYCLHDVHILYHVLPSLRMDWFLILFWTNNSECIKLVLRNVTSAERKRLILSKFGIELCRTLAVKKKWLLLELFVKECAESNEAKKRLKNRVMLKMGYYVQGREKVRLRKKFLQLIDNSYVSKRVGCKRCIEELDNEQPISPKKNIKENAKEII